MTARERRKVSIPADIEDEVSEEARRLDRKPSWLLGFAWRVARERIRLMRAAHEAVRR